MEIELRVILLGVGLLILLIVAFDYFKRRAVNEGNALEDRNYKPPRAPTVPTMEEYADRELDIYQSQAAQALPDTDSESEINNYVESDYIEDIEPAQHHQNIITISIMSRDTYGFAGSDLLAAFEGAQLQFGNNDVFYRIEEDEILFSVVNAVEPGYFIIETLPEEHVPGITLIFLPEQVSTPTKAFDKLIRTAKQIAFAVNGELIDHSRSPLTLSTIDQYRANIELM